MSDVPAFQDSEFRLSNRKRLLKGLFFETTLADKTGVKYTLKDEDHLGYPSLSRLYLEISDPTEYQFAVSCLESWDHWEQLCECNWFKPYVARWRRELEMKLKSEALAAVMKTAKANGKDGLAANRYLIDRGWEPKSGQTKRGRPTKDEIRSAALEQVEYNKRLEEDFQRLQVN